MAPIIIVGSIRLAPRYGRPILSMPDETGADETSFVGASQPIPPMPDAANYMEADSPQVENSTGDRIPKVGMKFCTEEEAYQFYNAYARDKGFSIRRSSSHNVKNSTTIKYITFCCSRAGVRRPDKKEEYSSYSRPETRCMCEASMKISLTDGLYCIYEFEPEHNHILATSSQVHHLRSQRKITEAQLASVENAKAVGISNKATFDLMAKESEKLAEDVEKSLKIKADSDVGTLSHPQGSHSATQEEDQAIKPKGLKVKEKEIHGSKRPIGGREGNTAEKKTKNDPMASGSATEANTRWKKKGKNDPKAYGPAVEVDNVTYEQPHYIDCSFFGTPNHGQDTQQGNVTQSFNTNPYNVFANFK
ncbi:unnamed protein product [Miscanthus lutarioriparius]|uniref:FAR1 domain-containing protein n=1 Tax=Miscanthus lutarioriparius TaxID=422564 RepID=A0A811QC91_9POAL|nr:unnamed protein product [Miscanthus lutarioriparius]